MEKMLILCERKRRVADGCHAVPRTGNKETGNRKQKLDFVILSLFCEGSCQSER